MIRLFEAIQSIRPGANFSITGSSFAGINWLSPDIEPPSEAEVIAELARMQAVYDADEYKRQRALHYPRLDSLLVALWEASIEGRPEAASQLEAVRQEIKQRYPKPGAP